MPEPALPVRIREANVAEHAAARAWPDRSAMLAKP